MKLLSIDVGIKNLAFCLFSKNEDTNEQFIIKKWDIIDISEEEDIEKCGFIEKNNVCNKPCKFKMVDFCYCLKHAKKQKLQVPKSEQKMSFLNKQPIKKLFEFADKYAISVDKKMKKQNLLNVLNQFLQENFLQPIETKKCAGIELFTIGTNIKTKFDKLFENEERIEYIIIENQIGPIATRMKTIQGMIVQYFIMSNIEVFKIDFISASNKLKVSTNIENTTNTDIQNITTYKDRKKVGISNCLEIISSTANFQEHIEYFKSHKKKDDLSDSFLQGMWFIENKKI